MSLEILRDAVKLSPSMFYVAYSILSSIVPFIMNPGNYIGERIAVAWTWMQFVCKMDAQLCDRANIPKSPQEWGPQTLSIIADTLIEYASKILTLYFNIDGDKRQYLIYRGRETTSMF